MNETTYFRCPICLKALEKLNKSYVCTSRHTFDCAKEGYVNLLPVNKKKRKDPGDNAEMIASREEFLSKGYFDELVATMSEFVEENACVLDVGTGSGYYLRKLRSVKDVHAFGIDISKHAVSLASKKDKSACFAVASCFSLPFFDNSFDCLLNVFAPKAQEEYERVLKRGGVLLEVVPGKEHLIEIKNVLYDNVRLNDERKDISAFDDAKEIRVKYKKTVLGPDLLRLLEMTPYRYKTELSALEKLSEIQSLSVTFDFLLRVMKKQ